MMQELSALGAELIGSPPDHSFAMMVRHRTIAADLHDTVLQPIVSLVVSLDAMERRLRDMEEMQSKLLVCKSLAHEALTALRAVLTETQVHPHVRAGLEDAIEQHLRPQLQGGGIQLHARYEGNSPTVPSEWLSHVYLIVREAATNAEKHAHATDVTIEVVFADEALSITVADNGTGFSAPEGGGQPPSQREHYGSGLGLSCMRDRVTSLGGALTLVSRPGQGTRLLLQVPYPPC